MADGERLGASFSIDVTELKAGLAQANRLIRESESEFKAATAGMDKWGDTQEGLNAKIKSLNEITDIQRKKVDALQEEYERLIADGLDPTSKQAVELRTKINNETAALNKNEAELERQKKALEEVGKETKEAGDAAEEASDGFTVMKGAAANLVSQGVSFLIDGCKNAVTTLLSLADETREYREDIGKLNTAFEAAGKTTDQATGIYKEFYSVIGEEDRSVEAVNHLAKFVSTEQDMAKWTNIAAGVWGTFGDSLPIEGLTEASNETAKVGKVTGVLADALNWAGVNEDKFNESLEKCNTEQERAKLITNTLNGLYDDAASLYKENNKSVIAARKATSDYTDKMAELGEAMEPVNADITELKSELASEFVPVIKRQVAPAIKDFVKELKDSGAIKATGKVVGFVADNFETLAKSTLTAVTVYKTFSAAMKVSTAITATKTAVSGLTAGVGLATKAQVGWNAAMTANPIGAVITATALLATGITYLVMQEKNAIVTTYELTEEQKAAITAGEELAEKYKEVATEADEMAAAEMAQLDNTQKLWQELQTLADKNGVVKKGEEDRANFIINELNNALGTEYSMTGNVIKNYNDMVVAIQNVITTKRAQVLLEAQEKKYKSAIEGVAEAEKARATQAQELVLLQQDIDAKKAQIADAEAIRDSTADARTKEMYNQKANAYTSDLLKLQETLDGKQAKYRETDDLVKQYYDDITGYETASTLVVKGETDKAVSYLERLGGGFKTAASVAGESKEKQLEVLRQQVIDTEVQLGLLEADYEQNQKSMTEAERKEAKKRIDNARKQATDAKEEYYKVGGNMIDGMEKGANDGEWKLTGAMKNIVTKAIAAAKAAAGIKSPSRVFRKEVGVQIPAGAALGVEDGTPSVVKAIKKQVKAMRDAYDLSGVAGAINTGVNVNQNSASKPQAQVSSVNVYQTNNYKQAYESPIEKYKSKQELFAAARLIKAGAY